MKLPDWKRWLNSRRKPKVTVPRAEAAAQDLPVYAYIDTAKKTAIFRIEAGGVTECDRLPDEPATVFVFDGRDKPRDVRIVLEVPTRERAVKELVRETLSEDGRIFRVPSDPRVVYARSALSIEHFSGHRVIPGAMVIDHVIGTQVTGNTVFPLAFHDGNARPVLLLLYPVRTNESGRSEIGSLQETFRPDGELGDAVVAFARRNKIDLAGREEEIEGLSERDLFTLANELPYYPTEPDLFGIPVSRVAKWGAVGTGALLGVSLAANTYLGIEAGYLTVSAQLAVGEKNDLSRKVTQTLTRNVRSFASAMSIDEDFAIRSAQAIWHPNAVTKIRCTPSKYTLDLIGAIERTDTAAGKASAQLVSNVIDEALVRDILLQAAPQGFQKQNIAVSGDANVITITFEHKKTDSPLFGLLPN